MLLRTTIARHLCVACVGLASGLTACANGITVTSPLNTNSDAMPGFHDSVTFYHDWFSEIIGATIDYAVFAPGVLDISQFTLMPGSVAPAPGDYLYLYQVHTLADSVGLSMLSVGMHSGGYVNALGWAYSPSPVGNKVEIGSDFVKFYFMDTTPTPKPALLPPSQSSDLLMFSSPYAPALNRAYVLDSGLEAEGHLPSPVSVPTPPVSAVGLTGLLALIGLAWRRARQTLRPA